MASANHRKATRQKVQAHRDRLRAQGLRPVQIWVPDTRSTDFATQAHVQSLAAARSKNAADDQGFINAISVEIDY